MADTIMAVPIMSVRVLPGIPPGWYIPQSIIFPSNSFHAVHLPIGIRPTDLKNI